MQPRFGVISQTKFHSIGVAISLLRNIPFGVVSSDMFRIFAGGILRVRVSTSVITGFEKHKADHFLLGVEIEF